jgi:hypothetical protein
MDNRSVANDYHEQIYSYLYPHFNDQLSPRVHTPAVDMRTFLQTRAQEHADLGAKILLDVYEPVFSMSRRRKLSEMTVEQLEDMTKFMRALAHVGRAQRTIRMEGQEILAGYVERTIARTANQTFQKRFAPVAPVKKLGPRESGLHTAYKKVAEVAAPIEAGLQRVEYICRRLDGFKDGGMAAKWIYGRAVEAAQLAEKLHKNLLRTRYKGIWDNYQTATGGSLKNRMSDVIGTVHGEQVAREKAILMYLHLQGDDNAELLLRGLNKDAATPIDRGQLNTQLKDILDAHDLKLADDILDLMDETFPMLAKVHENLTGLTLQKVRGRYMPMRQAKDTKRYGDTSESFIGVILDSAHRNTVKEVQRHLLKTRHGGLTELDLSFGGITQHLHDVVHVSSHAEFLHDVNKIISRPSFKRMMDDNVGYHVRKELDNWLTDLARPPHTEVPALSQIRQNVTMMTLGLKVLTAAKQPLAAITAMAKVPPARLAQGFATIVKRGFNNDDIMKLSQELPMRWNNRIRECAEAIAVYDPFHSNGIQASPKLREAFMYFSNWMDQVTAETVWRGAYSEGLEKYAKQGDIIFDPFAGSGTFLVSAQNLGFEYIGCELDKEYFEIAQERLGYVKQRLF